MVVETPKGSLVKLEYDEQLGHFTISHGLALGITYPFDWGFVPGTLGEDGDPIDALAIHDAATYQGVIMTCKALGVVDVEQKAKKGRISNPRFDPRSSLASADGCNRKRTEFASEGGLVRPPLFVFILPLRPATSRTTIGRWGGCGRWRICGSRQLSVPRTAPRNRNKIIRDL
jgi:hypothetical protein